MRVGVLELLVLDFSSASRASALDGELLVGLVGQPSIAVGVARGIGELNSVTANPLFCFSETYRAGIDLGALLSKLE